MSHKNKWLKKMQQKEKQEGFFSMGVKNNSEPINKKNIEVKDNKKITTIKNGKIVEINSFTKENKKENNNLFERKSHDVNENVSYHAIFKGDVQNVGFRNTVERQAEKCGVYGTAENLKDKSVECYFYGRMRDIALVIQYMLSGNTEQRVIEMSFEQIKEKKFTKFEVIREIIKYENYGGMYGGGYSSQSRFKDFFGYSFEGQEMYPNQKQDDAYFWEQMEKNKVKVPKEHEKSEDDFSLYPLKKLEEENKNKAKCNAYMYDDFMD